MSFGLILLALLGYLSESRRTADDLTGIKCVVSGQAAGKNYSCTYKQGTVYFNCHASRHKFENRREEFETRANHQLVVTGQYVQRQCPIRNVPVFLRSTTELSLAGVELRFCCEHCRKQLKSRGGLQQQIAFIFGPGNFDRVFEPTPISALANSGMP